MYSTLTPIFLFWLFNIHYYVGREISLFCCKVSAGGRYLGGISSGKFSAVPEIFLTLINGLLHLAQAPPEEDVVPVNKPEDKFYSNLSYPIAVPELEYYVKNETGIEFLKAQFHTVVEGQRKSWDVGTSEANIKKNRYDDLPAYDETRVVLELLEDDSSSDYINANYINGYYRDKEYVATQGPLPNTVNDFWRMIWQLQTHKIIMLANVMEHGEVKVEKYWPDNNGTYGDLFVKMVSEKTFRDHVVRTFLVLKEGETSNRIVRQFHYTGWPDFGVPQDRLSVIALLQQARKYRPYDIVPMVVHCSAGVGRTGTVILTDSSLQRAIHENEVDIYNRLDVMRQQRINVVEKEVQYVFAHEAIWDYFYGNGTHEYLQEFDDWYNEQDSTESSEELSVSVEDTD